jgi:hypothetical protein
VDWKRGIIIMPRRASNCKCYINILYAFLSNILDATYKQRDRREDSY